ncbi:hypothetical protein [Actinacidiphila rubida]|uniref:hypothetical protein n=1 Tax=Actinacidiphila rubida TaxID=310780 RepID=UPI00114CFB12|nr:hypothetical protein [Actinacidiphila rubida]
MSKKDARYLAEQAKYDAEKARWNTIDRITPPLLGLVVAAITAFSGHVASTPGGTIEKPTTISIVVQEPAQK